MLIKHNMLIVLTQLELCSRNILCVICMNNIDIFIRHINGKINGENSKPLNRNRYGQIVNKQTFNI